MQLGSRLRHIPVIDIIIIILGAILLNQFYENLALGHLTFSGFQGHVFAITKIAHTPEWWKSVLRYVSKYAIVYSSLYGPCLVAGAILMIFLLYRGLASLLVSAFFFLYWMTLWAVPGSWVFEFLFPALFALFCGLGVVRQIFSGDLSSRAFGVRVFGALRFRTRLAIVVLSSALLWYVIYLSTSAKELHLVVAWQTALSFGFLFFISALLDGVRTLDVAHTDSKRECFWIQFMILSMGAMLIMQVFSNQAVNFFTVKGYASLAENYAKTSSAPEWYRHFLMIASTWASVLMPLQKYFEIAAATCLTIFVFRGPVLLLTTGLFAALSFAEFGVYAAYPGGPGTPLTSTWELLFVTLCSLFIALQAIGRDCFKTSWRTKVLGYRLFARLSFLWRVALASCLGLALYAAGLVTQVFGPKFPIISLRAGIFFGALLLVNFLLDYLREPQIEQ